jgi:3-demethoxyubiquinol 3-hydroxylase
MDSLILGVDRMLRTLSGAVESNRMPTKPLAEHDHAPTLTPSEQAKSVALMRVNHAGEVAAQALYQGQAMFSRDTVLRKTLGVAADEELDHLVWTRRRIVALGGRTSVFDPLWYVGSFAIGAAAATLGDKASLGFLEATEQQVEAHLESHLASLPANDHESRRIVEAMRADEAKHAQTARTLGAETLSPLAQWVMKRVAKVMTTASAKI